MPWQEDDNTGEEWWEGSGIEAIMDALDEADPDSIVAIDVRFAKLKGYSKGGPKGWMQFFENGVTVAKLQEYLGSDPEGYLADVAAHRGATQAEGITKHRLFFLERYPSRPEEGRARHGQTRKR
jgi:hypothetical protein